MSIIQYLNSFNNTERITKLQKNMRNCFFANGQNLIPWFRDIWYGSVWLTYGSGSCFFCQKPSKCQQIFFAYYYLKVHLHHTKSKIIHKTEEIKVFLTIL
jgi:hypothetical protein